VEDEVDTGDTAGDTAEPDGDTGGPEPEEVSIDDLSEGDLIITEIMVNPSDCDDADAEYFEIYNAGATALDLTDMTVTDNFSTETISYPDIVDAGSFAVGILNSTSRCYGLPADFQFDDIALSNSGDILEIANSTETLDSVDFSSWTITSGAALSLDDGALDATSNDDGANWCDASATFGGSTADLGTPGSANDSCD
ncbi:MAG: lamin tail domain-containing protein, partial [Myxococcota bacterium]|nr:lamin tail domain-containing protein [Myxococcota bacterium]